MTTSEPWKTRSSSPARGSDSRRLPTRHRIPDCADSAPPDGRPTGPMSKLCRPTCWDRAGPGYTTRGWTQCSGRSPCPRGRRYAGSSLRTGWESWSSPCRRSPRTRPSRSRTSAPAPNRRLPGLPRRLPAAAAAADPSASGFARRDAEELRVELVHVVHQPGPAHGHLAGLLSGGIEKRLDIPARRGNLAGRVDAVANDPPEILQVAARRGSGRPCLRSRSAPQLAFRDADAAPRVAVSRETARQDVAQVPT